MRIIHSTWTLCISFPMLLTNYKLLQVS
jgi:hypothetical protein